MASGVNSSCVIRKKTDSRSALKTKEDKMANQERRKFPRIHDEGLSLKLNAGDFDSMTHTTDISASGIYCKIGREIPLMSRVKLAIMVPDTGEGRSLSPLEVDGVVVREHPVIIDGVVKHYDAAIFFDNLSEKNREMIQSYISSKKKGEAAC